MQDRTRSFSIPPSLFSFAIFYGGMVCIAAANAGATSQDLKTGFLVGATPRSQQLGLFIGVVAAAVVALVWAWEGVADAHPPAAARAS